MQSEATVLIRATAITPGELVLSAEEFWIARLLHNVVQICQQTEQGSLHSTPPSAPPMLDNN